MMKNQRKKELSRFFNHISQKANVSTRESPQNNLNSVDFETEELTQDKHGYSFRTFCY